MAGKRHTPSALPLRHALLCMALLTAACGPDDAAGPVVDAPVTPQPIPAPALPSVDLDPPLFSGVQRVALLGESMLRVSWDPARDNRTATGNLRYHVYHVPELFLELEDVTEPLVTTEPGATSVVVDAFLPGRIFVRAEDEAGLQSALGGTLYQRVERPVVSARDGRPVTTILGCATLGPGRAICAGEDGFAARWDRDHWTALDVPAGVNWHVEPSTDSAFLYSDIGHLYRIGNDDSVTPLDVRFDIVPELPIRRFTSGPLGLLWWIDSTGAVYVGVPGDFRRMEHPLTLPASEGCARLQTIAFSATSGFAICEDGTVFSARFDQAELRWSSLTVTTPFSMVSATTGVFASDDTAAIFYGPAGIHRVGVGGWTPIVPAGEPLSSLDPRSPVPTTFPQVEASGVTITAATDIGILQGPEGFFELVSGTELPLAGFTLPSPLESQTGVRIVTTDGSVAWVDNGRRQWEVPPRLLGFVAGATLPDGTLLAATSSAVYRLAGDDWQELAPLPASGDSGFQLHFVAPDNARGGLLAGATSGESRLFLRQVGSGWVAEPLAVRDVDGEQAALARMQESIAREHARAVAAMDPPPVPPPTPPVPPLQPLLSRPARAGELAPLEQPVDVDTAPDGRGIMVTEHAVWWRLSGGTWIQLVERTGRLDAVALDAGPSYILVEDGQPYRCVRDVCEEGVPDAEGAPLGVRAVWRDAQGLLAMLGDAAVVRFVPADGGTGPWQDLASVPAGRWEPVLAAPEARLPNGRILGRWTQNGADLMWLEDGSVFELKEGQWIRQGQIDGGLALWVNESGWGILGRNGLLTLAPVPDATF